MAVRGWDEAVAKVSSERVRQSLRLLYEGHRRFLNGKPQATSYTVDHLKSIAENQKPVAAVVACSDSRVAPEILFDQPLGGIFASRVPGNVASDSAKWMLDIAVTELRVPLVLVLGHTRCLAVGQMLEGKVGGAGGTLRFDVQKAIHRAKMKGGGDLYRLAVIENVRLTVENLMQDSSAVMKASERGEVAILGAYYDMDTGEVNLI